FLVGVGGIIAGVVFDVELLAAEFFGEAVGALERGEAGVQAGDGLIDGEEVFVAPEGLGAFGDGLAGDFAFHGGVVVFDLVGAEALLADVEGLDADAVSAFLTLETFDVAHGHPRVGEGVARGPSPRPSPEYRRGSWKKK